MEGITVVSPMWGTREKTDRMIFSVLHQFVSKKNPFKIHLVLVDDYIEGRNKHGDSYYDIYTSEYFKQFYDPELIKITIIKNEEHKYQGESREIGFMAGDYDWFLLLDCDDMLAPNACDRFLHIVHDYYSKPVEERPNPNLACIHGLLYSFDTHGYGHNIPGHSIWVQGRCYNRQFCVRHGIHFPTGLNSRQGEDYPFIRKFDYALNHDPEYGAVKVEYEMGKDCQATAFWFPNPDSLSRQDPHYGQHLSGWTMGSSNNIIDYFEEFNKKHNIDLEEDENLKHEVLNMNVYAFFNLLDFLKEVSLFKEDRGEMKKWDPKEEDWYELRNNVKRLRDRLKATWWDEIVYSDVDDMLFNVKHHSDVRFCEPWHGTFFDYMEEEWDVLSMSYDEMIEYARGLEFDGAGHEIHSKQVVAWMKRHPQPETPKDLKDVSDEEIQGILDAEPDVTKVD